MKATIKEWLDKTEITKRSNKIKAFEYFVWSLLPWLIEAKGKEGLESNDLSPLKVLQLLFLACSVKSHEDDRMLHLFDKFVAMPMGPIEEDVYKAIKERDGVFSFFTLTNKGLKLTRVPTEYMQ